LPSGFYWLLLAFTGFYWLLLAFTGFYWLLALSLPALALWAAGLEIMLIS